MKKINFWSAIEWICDECGRNNFTSMVAPEMSENDEQEAREMFNIEDWEDGEFLTAPDLVTCNFCEEKFELNIEDLL